MPKNTRTHLTLTTASKQSGISKSIISRALKSKELNASRVPIGKGKRHSYQIDKSDFAIWEQQYNETRRQGKNTSENIEKELKRTPKNIPENTLKIRELELELEFKEKEIEQIKNQLKHAETKIEDMGTDRDAWRNQAEKLLLAPPEKQNDPSLKRTEVSIWDKIAIAAIVFLSVGVLGFVMS